MTSEKKKYAIHASIHRKGENAYAVKARIQPAFFDASGIAVRDEEETCDPCEYPQARILCYKFVARLAYEIGKGEGEVVDVFITDEVGTGHSKDIQK